MPAAEFSPPVRWLRALAVPVARRVPYGLAVRTMLRLSRSPLGRVAFRREWRRIRWFHAHHAVPGVAWDTVVRRHGLLISRRVWASWHHTSVEVASRAELEPWFEVTGLETLRAAGAGGRGVILLNSHFGAGMFVPAMLAKLGVEMCVMHGRDLFKHLPEGDARRLKVVHVDPDLPGRALVGVERQLRRGAVVQLVGDTTTPGRSVEVPFLGRCWRARCAAAELSLRTGAPMVPVLAPFDGEGRARIEIVEPLDPGPPSDDDATRVRRLVGAYAALMERAWREDPGNVWAVKLEMTLNQSTPGPC